ncbi:BZ3500_MvSof-1268-A1-R1_Chr7-2g09501 [Microbotryum saponariae]|uniref:Lysophospholipase NTE1 n=1 Tax=Microbotryum saponariae TaxID=289078 RepID=A0A2X0L770_9BASI|nr:BZ3501_MvSof-1269-A2-R1_Chr7-1g09201 [Microbotryum saponariae]SDA02574.1 BZ3500_MvSof-1268-A1-R1_Chr7-2g09501 [Microbotryum saponariae]
MDAIAGKASEAASAAARTSAAVATPPPFAAPTASEDFILALNSILRLTYYVLSWSASASAHLAAFVTLTLPRWAFLVLHWGATITLRFNFMSVIITLFIGATILSYVWKVRYLNRYTTLKVAPLEKDEGFDLHPDLVTDQAQPRFHNYLDEFLSAIKVFGYLEKPVFHELARHLQTRRLIAGDTLNLDQDKSFYIVVDGSVQVFAQTSTSTDGEPARDAYDDEDNNGYQLLNNVESGGTLSSLFTILSLFTEDVKLRYEENEHFMGSASQSGARPSASGARARPRRASEGRFGATRPDRNFDVTDFHLDDPNYLRERRPSSGTPSGRRSRSPLRQSSTRVFSQPSLDGSVGTIIPEEGSTGDSTDDADNESGESTDRGSVPRPSIHPFHPASQSGLGHPAGAPGFSFEPSPPQFRGQSFESTHGNGKDVPKERTIARATTDTTLAVIPAEAFRRLTKKFPNAAAHIVQVILTRLQRVTFLTAHKYLGLTREVIRTEKAINELACYPLPDAFWESGGIHRLRQRFQPETKLAENPVDDDHDDLDYFTMATPIAGPAMGDVFWGNDTHKDHEEGVRLKYRPPANRKSRGGMSTRKAGDLLTMSTPADEELRSIHFSPLATPRIERSSDGPSPVDDFDLRQAVMESISKAIGLVHHAATPSASIEASPMVRPTEAASNLQKAVFNSSFGSLSFLGMHAFDDESSVTGSSIASFSSTELENEVEVLFFPKGSTLVKEGEKNAGLYFVIEGFLDVSMPEPTADATIKNQEKTPTTNIPTASSQTSSSAHSRRSSYGAKASGGPTANTPLRRGSTPMGRPKPIPRATQAVVDTGKLPPMNEEPSEKTSTPLFTVKPGGIAGYLSSLSGFPSYVDITAKTECYVGFLPAKALDRIMDRKPIVLLTLAKRLISLLSPLILHIDSALDWQHVSAGQVIYRQGEPADSFYIVINGRLRSINEKAGGGVEIESEYGQGESVGELDCITASTRPSTLHAIRDSELARMPMTLFNAISVRHPLVTIQISRIIAARLRSQVHARSSVPLPLSTGGMDRMGKDNFNLKTVAIIPTNRHVPVSVFSTKLLHALESMGALTSYLNQATVMQVLGRHAFSRMGTLKLAGWLAETEQKYRIVLYVADTAVSAPWTQTCIRQADCILLVADGGSDPGLGEYEKLLVSMKTTARKELILLHSERTVPPGTTRPWLKNRPWIHAHHHIEMIGATPETMPAPFDDPAPVVALRKIARRVEVQIGKYRKSTQALEHFRPPALNDFARLARRLCGKSIGIVLGGGGARGISHIGVIQALVDQGIPIDMVGGTSIGSFVGGLYAREGDLVSTYGRAKRFSGRMSTLWRILTDLTYPVVAYTTVHLSLGHEFNRGIYKSFYDVHIEDMWLPFFCNTTNITHSRMEVHTTGYAWRYIRASMSLAGLLPPLCDAGDMLVDGGYVDNLPVSVMLSMGAASVFAVDVGSVDDTSPRSYGESVSGWWLLVQRWNPFATPSNIPNITEIQSRLTYVSSVKMLEEAKATPGVLYMRMPVTQFGTMEFKRFGELFEIGQAHAKELLTKWGKEGQLPTGTVGEISAAKVQKRGHSIRRNSI